MAPVSEARAHKLEHPKSLRLGLAPGAVVLAVTYDVDPGDPSKMLRGLFDRDGDLRLDAGEQAKLVQYLEATATLWLKVEVDGAPLALTRRSREPGQLDLPVGSSQAVGISLVYTASVAAPIGRLWLTDRDKDARTHVPVVVDVAPELRVRAANRGEWHPRLRQIHRVALGPSADLVIELVRPPP